jgi:alpha-L-rhamnosidase
VLPGRSAPGFDDRDWLPCAVTGFDRAALVAPDGPPVCPVGQMPVREVLISPSGRTLLDFGQNLVGTLRIQVTGPSGTVVRLRHAEVLEHGELGVRPLRTAAATDGYTLPVLALPGGHGSHDHLGAVGQHAARRQHQPG